MKQLTKLLFIFFIVGCTSTRYLPKIAYNPATENPPPNKELIPKSAERHVIGYKFTKRNAYYIVINGYNRKEPRIREDCDSIMKPIGTTFYLDEIYWSFN